MRHSSVQVQPDDALFNPLMAAKERQRTPDRRSKSMLPLPIRSEPEPLPQECDRFHADIAVLAVGSLGGDEERRLLDHLDGCPRLHYCEGSCRR